MSRIRRIVALAAVMTLAVAGVATAAVTPVTGGTTQISVSSGVQSVLAANHLSVTPLAPATAAGATFSFPITRGHLNTTNLHGRIHHAGGLALSNGSSTVRLRRLTIVSDAHGISLLALAAGPAHRRCHRTGRYRLRCVVRTHLRTARIARVTNLTTSGGTASATVNLTPFSARVLNRLAGKTIATAGTPIGTVTIAPTLS